MRFKTSWVISPRNLIWMQIYYNLVVKFLINDLGAPSALNYFTDFITIILLLIFLKSIFYSKLISKRMYLLSGFIGAFIIFGFIGTILNKSEILLFIWSLRSAGRFFVWILCAGYYLKFNDLKKQFMWWERLALINLFIMIVQYTFFGLRDDYLNGIFGSYAGGNSAINTFFVILTIENFAFYFEKKKKLSSLLLNLSVMALSSALNELKFYFVELVLVVIILVLIQLDLHVQREKLRKILMIVIGSILAGIGGFRIFLIFYPKFATFFQKDVFLDYLTRSYNSSTILYVNNVPIMNRLSSYGIIMQSFLTTPIKLLLGIGMGAGDRTAFFSGSFYTIYGKTGYGGYLLANILLENGILGLVLFIVALIWIYFFSKGDYKNGISRDRALIVGCAAIFTIVLGVYNSALKIESSGYIYATIIALGFIKERVGYDKEYNKKNSIQGKV